MAFKKVASSVRVTRERNVRDLQFPAEMEDAAGTFMKPPNW